MASPYTKYLGNRCATIHSFGLVMPGNKKDGPDEPCRKAVEAYAEQNPGVGLLAITADYYQTHIHQYLKGLGFRSQFTCKSSHGNPHENLTIWTKPGDKSKKLKDQPVEFGPGNCSVGFNPAGEYDSTKLLVIETTDPKKKTFKKIRGINVWYKVAKKYLVKTK